jgi:hypothetical protein
LEEGHGVVVLDPGVFLQSVDGNCFLSVVEPLGTGGISRRFNSVPE